MPAGWVAAAGAIYSAYTARKTAKERQQAVEAEQARQRAEEERARGEAQRLMGPSIEQAERARGQLMIELGLAPGEAGTAYMETPGYQAAQEERQRMVRQEQAGLGQLYSGRRIQAAGEAGADVQSQFYANYMNMLQNMASPGTAQSLAAMGMGQAGRMGQYGLAAQQQIGAAQYERQAATSAAIADIARGYSAYQSQQANTGQQQQQQQQQEQGEWI